MYTRIDEYRKANGSSDNDAAAVVLVRDGRALILQRGDTAPWEPGKWNLPGGKIESGESAADSAERECQEETGLTPLGMEFICKRGMDGWHVSFYAAYAFNGLFELNDESKDFAWIRIADIERYAFVPFVAEAIIDVLSEHA